MKCPKCGHESPEDANFMVTAVAAGMVGIGAGWGFCSAQELTASGPRVIIPPQDSLSLFALSGPK